MSYTSPTRKRPDERPISPVKAPPLPTRFPPVPPEHDDEGSPRTQVAGQFQQMHISHYGLNRQPEHDGHPSKRLHYTKDEFMDSFQESVGAPTAVPEQIDGTSEAQTALLEVPTSQNFTFERSMSTVFGKGETARPKSPSLKGEVSDRYWHESEITGHDPDDPDDDGYGINGIGFKPTSAMAHARTQKRKQQIAEYRSREAKEARARRSERRKVGSAETKMASPVPDTPGPLSKSRVRFEEVD